ncbi:hypothetical protein [Ammoniphilus sp. 3BR4]|uniref:hypothetical protein n=1 Tax=Ammoniphilus sp. 3BR4 TaxID=3158265 RepID=UPI0034662125
MYSQAQAANQPLFHPVILSDWLPKLGEKAFLAWIQFHSWMKGHETPQDSILIPTSLNKIIKRLKTGKATFYEKILRPLVDFGLVQLQPAPHSKQELHLVVYASPVTDTSNQNPTPEIPVKESIEELESILEDSQPETPQPPHKKSTPLSTSASSSLPQTIEQAISQDSRLLERRTGIQKAFNQCKDHPHYSEQAFVKKMLNCVGYRHNKHLFGAYLLKSILNEWDNLPTTVKAPIPCQQQPSANTANQYPMMEPCPPGVPPWVWKQLQLQKLGIVEEPASLHPDQKAISDKLLRQLGELSS